MAFGDYSGPDKPNKGHENGSCNRQRCQAEPARWYNHGSYAWYCDDCRHDIGDRVGEALWKRDFPECEHPMFETREHMNARGDRS